MSTPEPINTVSETAPLTVQEPDMECIEDMSPGTAIRLTRLQAPEGHRLHTPIPTIVAPALQGADSFKPGVHKGQCLYFGELGQCTTAIQKIERMSDGSFYVGTADTLYRLERVAGGRHPPKSLHDSTRRSIGGLVEDEANPIIDTV